MGGYVKQLAKNNRKFIGCLNTNTKIKNHSCGWFTGMKLPGIGLMSFGFE
jgi:hypothetical protein